MRRRYRPGISNALRWLPLLHAVAHASTSGGFVISTFAGGALPPTALSGTAAAIASPAGVAADGAGNIYFSSSRQNAVFKLDAGGTLFRVAGTGIAGYSGDGGPAMAAQLNGPQGIAFDASGNLWIADTGNQVVRKIGPNGTISTVAGTGAASLTGDGGPAAQATLSGPTSVAVTPSGVLYIADTWNNRVRQVSATGTITTFAGTSAGFSGDGGSAAAAQLNAPQGIAVDAQGNLYVADTVNSCIRKITPGGTISTAAGICGTPGNSGDGGSAASATFSSPAGVAVDTTGNLYVADSANSRVRQVSSAGTVTTLAGSGIPGSSGDGAAAINARLAYPLGLAADKSGNVYIADTGGNRLRKVAGGTISTVAGGGSPGDGAVAVWASFAGPAGMARDNSGNLYIADTGNHRVRKVTPAGVVSAFAGTGAPGFSGDNGAATSAQLNSPCGVAVDISGNVYIADTGNSRIRKVAPTGTITTFAGGGPSGTPGDNGPAASASLNNPSALALDGLGNLYIADTLAYRIRKVSPAGTITTVAGTGTYGYAGDGGSAAGAQLARVYGIAVDVSNNLYIADSDNNRIRKVSGGFISTVAGTGAYGSSGDGGAAANAQLSHPRGVSVDSSGVIYVADTMNSSVRKVSGGSMSTLAGGGLGYAGDGGSPSQAFFNQPVAVLPDSTGRIYIADSQNNAIRVLVPAATQPVFLVQATHGGGWSAGQNGAGYTVTVSNAAQAGATPGGWVTLTPHLPPAGLTLVSLSGTGWTCGTTSCARNDVLAAGGSYPSVSIQVNVSAGAPPQLTSQFSVTTGGTSMFAAGTSDLVSLNSAGPAATAVTNVASPAANGTYNAGATVPVSVTFNNPVTVAGSPQVALNSGGVASYASGTGTSTLTFNYVVAAGQASARLDYTSTGALTLNGGTIVDAGGNPASLTLPAPGAAGSLGADSNIVINTSPAAGLVVSTTATAGAYGVGAIIPIAITFPSAVQVTGSPQLALNSGGTATYAFGAGTATLTFNYLVASGQSTSQLDYTSSGALTLNGGTIGAGGNPASLTLPAPGAAGSLGAAKTIAIDTVSPAVTGLTTTAASGTYGAGTVIPISVTFSKNVNVIGSPQLTLNAGGSAAYTGGSGSNTLAFTYTVAAGQGAAKLDATTLSGGAIADTDTAPNFANLALPANALSSSKTIVIDTGVPVVTALTSTAASGTYGIGSVILINAAFSKNVIVTGAPQLALNSGGIANYTSGSGTGNLTFTYTVAAGQSAAKLDATTLSGGSIGDTSTPAHAANLTLPANGLGSTKTIVIDTGLPAVAGLTTPTAAGTYGIGSAIVINVIFSKSVIVTGAPQLALNSGGAAAYTSGSGTSTLAFTYTVAAGQSTAKLDALALSGGSITDTNTPPNAANLSLPANALSSAKTIVVDTGVPAVVSLSTSTASGTYGAGAVILVNVTFSKNVSVTGAPQLALNSGGAAAYTSGSGTSILTFTYTVAAGQSAAKLDATTLSGGSITDTNSPPNAANLTLPANALSSIRTITIATGGTSPQVPSAVSVNPAFGTPGTQPMIFVFTDSGGFQNLQVVDVLINNVLDGRHACYLAFLPAGGSTGSILLVDDAGDAGGPYQSLSLPGNGTIGNGQCTIKGAGSSVTAAGTNLIVTLAISFSPSFAGNKVVYLAAQDAAANSGWQALGTLSVPASSNPGTLAGPAVAGLAPARSTQSNAAPYTYTFTDSNGWNDIAVANILIASAIDGRQACYLAIIPTSATSASVLLVDDAGDAAGPYSGMSVPGSGMVSNSQCTVSAAGSSVSGVGDTLNVTLTIAFNHTFAGNRVFFLAARSSILNTDWQAAGTISVP